jgi:hypothetical protein
MSFLLSVEGEGDREFFSEFSVALGIPSLTVWPPRSHGATGNGVFNLISSFQLLINEIKAGAFTRVGIIVDADYAGINGGFSVRRQAFIDKLSSSGYTIATSIGPGDRFEKPAWPDIHLFVLPDHASDGMLEDVIKGCIIPGSQSTLLSHAVATVGGLPVVLFNSVLHLSKAEVNTFMAWQKKPPATMGRLVKDGSVDIGSPALTAISSWLGDVCR